MILIVSGSASFSDRRTLFDILDALNGNQLGPGCIHLLRIPEAKHGAESLAADWASDSWMPVEVITNPTGNPNERLQLHHEVMSAEPKAHQLLLFGKDSWALHLAGLCRGRGVQVNFAPLPGGR